MTGGTTTFYPYPEEPLAQPVTIPTHNDVSSRSKEGADYPFSTRNVYQDFRNRAVPTGPTGAYLETGDRRGRDVHGGGSCAKDPYADKQDWCKTFGCTRAKNADLMRFAQELEAFRVRNTVPPLRAPDISYERVRVPFAR